MNDQPAPIESLVRCDYSGEMHPLSETVQIGGQNIAILHKDDYVEYLHQGGVISDRQDMLMESAGLGLIPVLTQSWALFLKTLPVLLAVYFTIELPCSLLSAWMDANVFDPDDLRKSIQFSYKLEWWIGVIATAGCIRVLSVSWEGGTPTYWESLAYGFSKCGRMWLLQVMQTIVYVLGLLLLVVPGILLIVRTGFAQCHATDGELSAWDSLYASYALTKGHFWRTVGYFLLIGFVALLPICGLPMLLLLLPEDLQHWGLEGAVSAIASVGVLFLLVVTFVYYKALLQVKEEIQSRSLQ